MRYSASAVKVLVWLGFVGMLLFLWAMTGSTTLAQAPRPTLTNTPAPTATLGPDATPAPAVEAHTGPNLRGRVINLSTGESESGVAVVFTSADSISVEVITGDDGKFAFDLGAVNGVLNAIPPRGSGLIPVTKDIAVRPKTGVETVVNLGISPNGSGAPPLIPRVAVTPDSVGVGKNMTITVIVQNTLPDAVSGAVVTNWLPASLVPVSIHSSTGNPYFSDNLAIVELGRLDAGSGALVEIVAQSTRGSSAASALQGKVSLFYRENAAAQAYARGSLNGATPVTLPVTGVGAPIIGLLLITVLVVAGWLRRQTGRPSPAD